MDPIKTENLDSAKTPARRWLASGVLVAFGVSTVLLAFQNCSSYSNSTFGGATSPSTTGGNDPSVVTFQVGSPDLQDLGGISSQFQVGGSCNTGGRKYNYFQYQLSANYNPNWTNCAGPSATVSSAPVVINNIGAGCPAGGNVNVAQTAFTRADARCENGHFYLVVPLYCPERGGPWLPGSTAGSPGSLSVSLVTCDSVDGNGACTNLNYQIYNSQISVSLTHQNGCIWPGY